MATTSPDNIWTPDSSEDYDYVIDAGATATSVQNALTRRANSYTGTTTERTAFTAAAPEGSLWSDTNGDKILWIKQGSSWSRIHPPVPNVVVVDGVSYVECGSRLFGEFPMTVTATGFSYTTYTINDLQALPSGYTYAWTVLDNPSAYAVIVNNADGNPNSSQRIRITAVAGRDTFLAGLRLGWRIHKI